MDDILIHRKTLEEHDARLQKVLNTIEKSGLKLNKDQCHIQKNELTYFGHTVGNKGVQPSTEKVKTIQNLVPELHTALGMINYLAKFTPGLSSLLQPLSDLTKSDAVWQWGPYQQEAFDKVKTAICNVSSLATTTSRGLQLSVLMRPVLGWGQYYFRRKWAPTPHCILLTYPHSSGTEIRSN
jgi:hypothetical protein